MNINFTTQQCQIHRVTQQAISSPGAPNEIVGDIEPCEKLMKSRKRKVGSHSPADGKPSNCGGFESDGTCQKYVCEPQCCDSGEDEEKSVNDIIEAPVTFLKEIEFFRGVLVDGRMLWAGTLQTRTCALLSPRVVRGLRQCFTHVPSSVQEVVLHQLNPDGS